MGRDAEIERLTTALATSVAAVGELITTPSSRPAAVPLPPVYGPDAAEDTELYGMWRASRAARRAAERQQNRKRLDILGNGPSISVLITVDRPNHEFLRACVASALDQDLERFEVLLCPADPGQPGLRALLDELAALGPQVLVSLGETGCGPTAAANRAASLSSGDFLAFLDQDDELEPGALAEVVLALAEDDAVDVLYTDEDRIDSEGGCREPFFKPGWSPDQLLSHMYVGRLLVVRRRLFEHLGGLRAALEGSADHDLALRATEQARRTVHLPTIAYHRRVTASAPHVAVRAALEDAVERRGEEASVEAGLLEGTFRVRRAIKGAPLVSVVVPFHDGAEFLRRCVNSLRETSGYHRWEAILVDNRSWEPETRALLARFSPDPRCRVLSYPGEFNWATINNYAVRQSTGDHLLFLNADVEGRSEGWMSAMLEHSQRPEIGAVGARLLYPDGCVQHAGVVLGLGGGVAWHAFCFCPGDHAGYFGQAKLVRNCSAVTGACMMVRRQVFESVGGFDEGLPVAYNDVDFCLKLQGRGYRMLYTPFAELHHAESVWRGQALGPLPEAAVFVERWGGKMERDPYFNPNLDLRRSEFTLPADGRRSNLGRAWREHSPAG